MEKKEKTQKEETKKGAQEGENRGGKGGEGLLCTNHAFLPFLGILAYL